MAGSTLPWFPFYVDRFLGGTSLMSVAAVGAYIRMLGVSWAQGPIPKTKVALAKAAGLSPFDPPFDEIWAELGPKWRETEAGWINDVLEEIRAEQTAKSEVQSQKGKAGAAAKLARKQAQVALEVVAQAVAQALPVLDSGCESETRGNVVPDDKTSTGTSPATSTGSARAEESSTGSSTGTSTGSASGTTDLKNLELEILDLKNTPQDLAREGEPARLPPGMRTPAENAAIAKDMGIELAPAAPRRYRPQLAISADVTRHLNCFGSGVLPSCHKGLCVPNYLIGRWEDQLRDDATVPDVGEYLRQFIADACRNLPPGAIGDDPMKFWRAQWAAKHGTIAPATSNAKADNTLGAARRVAARVAGAGVA